MKTKQEMWMRADELGTQKAIFYCLLYIRIRDGLFSRPFYKFLQPVQTRNGRIVKSIRVMLFNVVDIGSNINTGVSNMFSFTKYYLFR